MKRAKHKYHLYLIFIIITVFTSAISPSPIIGQPKRHEKLIVHSILKECKDTDNAKSQNFEGCHFETSFLFEGRQFDGFANFDNTIFENYANFEEITANSGISFKHAFFKNDFSLYRMLLPQKVSFDSAVFEKEARFERLSFDKSVSFDHCTFDERISFVDLTFTKASFSNLTLTENTNFAFHNSSAGALDFSFNPKIYNEIRLIDAYSLEPGYSDTVKVKPCLINLYKSDISKFYIDYLNYKLYFPKYYDPTDNIDSVEITSYEKKVIYEALLNNFKNHQQLDSYRLLDIEYQSFNFDTKGQYFYKWLSHYWWNFGYNKEYIFYWTLGLLSLFTFINFFFIERLNNRIYLIESMPSAYPRIVRLVGIRGAWNNIKMVWTRFWLALIYTTAIFFKVTIKIENFKFDHKTGTFYLFIIYISGLICLAYMANFVLQK